MSQSTENLSEATKFGTEDDVRKLVEVATAVEINWRDNSGWTALHCACYEGKQRIAKILLSHGEIQTNLKTSKGSTPFMLACAEGHIESVKVLLGDGRVRPNEANDQGTTPLWFSARNGFLEIVQWWIASGAEVQLGQQGVENSDAVAVAKESKNEVHPLLERFRNNQLQTRLEVRRKLGIKGKTHPF